MGVWLHSLPILYYFGVLGWRRNFSPATRSIVLFQLTFTFYFCFLFVFRLDKDWSWGWSWTRLAFGLSGTLFDDAFRDFFALEWLIFIS